MIHPPKLSRINEFVSDLPEGLNTIVGEKGSRLSGGQTFKSPDMVVMAGKG